MPHDFLPPSRGRSRAIELPAARRIRRRAPSFCPRDDRAPVVPAATRANHRRRRAEAARLARRAGRQPRARLARPATSSRCIRQIFIARGPANAARHARMEAVRHPQAARGRRPAPADLEQKQYCYVPSLSTRVIIYKGLMLADQVEVFTSIWPTRDSCRPWPWCISATAPTRFRLGTWPIRSAFWPITAKSTPCGATSTGCMPARACWPARFTDPI